MFDVAPTELLLVAIVALLVIGPKDLPKALRFAGKWVGKARGVARQFRSGFDSMVREAELADMEKKWAEENARIMREHPTAPDTTPQPALPSPEGETPPYFEPDPYSSEPVFGSPAEASHEPVPPPPAPAPPPAIRPAFADRPDGGAA